MIEVKQGDNFKSKARALVNPVNTGGSMAGGLARQFALRFPEVDSKYIEFSRGGGWESGVKIQLRGTEV